MKLNRPVEEQKIEMQYMSTFFRAKEGRGGGIVGWNKRWLFYHQKLFFDKH